MPYLNKEESRYLKSIIEQDYDNIQKFNYKFIPQYIKDHSKDLQFLNDDRYFRNNDYNIIDIINNNIEYRLSKETSNLIVYKLISYILRREMNFDIELLIEDKSFINIIKRALCFNTAYYLGYYKRDLEKVLEKQIDNGEDIISHFVDLLYKFDVENEKFKCERKLAFRLLAKKLIPYYENNSLDIIQNPISDKYLDNLKEELLLEYKYDNMSPINKGLVGQRCRRGIIEGIENIIETKFSTIQKPFEVPIEEINKNTKPQELTDNTVEESNPNKETKKINEEKIRKFIIDFLYDDLFLNADKSIDGYPRNLMKFLSDKRDRAIEFNKTEKFSNELYNKLEEINENTNTLFLSWKEKGYPLLTTKCKEPNLMYVFDFAFTIIRNQYKSLSFKYNASFTPIRYDNFEIVDYLDGAKTLIHKKGKVFEIEVIDFFYYLYMVNANLDIYQEFLDTIEETKNEIKEFLFLYIEYYVYKRFMLELINITKKELDNRDENIEKQEEESKNNKDINVFSNSNSSLQVGNYDEERTKNLYKECNNVVFKYCKLEDFVNSLNNPDECNLEVKNKSLLFVLYTHFSNFFESEAEIKRDKLNEKFGIDKKEDYQKHKYPKRDASKNQKNFDTNLSKI